MSIVQVGMRAFGIALSIGVVIALVMCPDASCCSELLIAGGVFSGIGAAWCTGLRNAGFTLVETLVCSCSSAIGTIVPFGIAALLMSLFH